MNPIQKIIEKHHKLGLALLLLGIRSTALVTKFLLTLYIAKYLNFEALGLYGLISAAAIIAPSMLGLGLPTTISRNAVTIGKNDLTHAIKKYSSYLGIVYGILAVISIGAGIILDKPLLVALSFAVILLEHLNNDLYQLFLNLSKPLSANILHFVRSALWVIVFIPASFIWTDVRTIEWLLGAWFIGSIISFLGSVWMMKDWPWKNTGSDKLLNWIKNEFRLSRTIFINGWAYSAGTYIDRYIISLFLGLELTGVYVLYWSVYSALCNLVRTGVIQTARPKLVRAYKEKSDQFANIMHTCLKHTLVVSALMGLGAAICLYFIIPFLHKPLAMEWFIIIWPIILSFIITMAGEVWGLIFYSQHKDGLTLKISVIQIICSVFGNFLLIHWAGLWGTSLTLILTSAVLLIASYYYTKKHGLLKLDKTTPL